MAKKNPRHFWIHDPINRENIYFCPNWDAKAFEQFVEKILGAAPEAIDDSDRGMTVFSPHTPGVFIWIKEFNPKKVEDLSVLVHESFHATSFILGSRGNVWDPVHHEHFTYHQQWIFKALLEQVWD